VSDGAAVKGIPTKLYNTQYTDPAHVHAPKVVNGETYTYDANGNLLTGGGRTLTWDPENRLQQAAHGGQTTVFTYDGDGMLVKREVVGGETTVYVGQHYERNVTTGQDTKYYYFGDQRVAMQQGGAVSFIHTDHLGSTSVMSDQAGNAVGETIRYFPYGTTRVGNPGTLPTDYLYTGQRRQEPLGGLYHMGARFYDPALGRWLSADSIIPDETNPQMLNRYAYALNNPIVYRDPSGHIVVASVGAFLAYKGVKAAGGALVTGGTYLWNARRTGTFNWKDFLLTTGTGAAATTLVGKAALMKGATAKIVKGFGTSMFISSEKHLVGNLLGGETFDSKDYIMDIGFGGAEGSISDWLGGRKVQKALALGGLAVAEFRVRARVDDEPIEQGDAAKAGLKQGGASYLKDLLNEWPAYSQFIERFREWLTSLRPDRE
jgi:RHS repeat-associated protein